MNYSHQTLEQVLKALNEAPIVAPRFMATKELEDVTITFAPRNGVILDWPSIKVKKDYLKRELAWYVRGDRYDLSIVEHAKIWADHVENRVLESQYGHYWFHEFGLMRVAQMLENDAATRRGVLPMIAPRHIRPDAKDVPCTLSMSFRIRDGILNASVHMRSQDAILGLRNDLPAFAMVQEILARFIGGLAIGNLTIHVDSFHVYERHFDLLDKIVTEEVSFSHFPPIDVRFAEHAIRGMGIVALNLDTPFANWLRDVPA